MQRLFTVETVTNLIARIEQLQPESKPLWGKMDVARTLAHCEMPILIALQEMKIKRSLFGMLFGKIAKRKLVGEKPFPVNLPTDKSFQKTDQRAFAVEKDKFVELVKRLATADQEWVSGQTHPFFGKMSPEWSILQFKHLDHHLRQFGV